MWAYGWKKTVCFGWHCITLLTKGSDVFQKIIGFMANSIWFYTF